VVGFASDGLVDERLIGVSAAGQGDVGHCAGSTFAEDCVAVVGGDALGGVHGRGVAQGDVLAQVVTVENDAGPSPRRSAARRLRSGSTAATRQRLPLRTWSG
jgi:hypothetical protein